MFLTTAPYNDCPLGRFIRDGLPPMDIENGPWVAGGSARLIYEQKPCGCSDIDVFFKDHHTMEAWVRELFGRLPLPIASEFMFSEKKKNMPREDISFSSYPSPEVSNIKAPFGVDPIAVWRGPMSYMFSVPYLGTTYTLQLVAKKFFNSMDDLLNDFDYTICMFGTDGKNIYYPEFAKQHLENKIISIHKVDATPKPNRLIKYISKGYSVGPGVLRLAMGGHIAENPNSTAHALLIKSGFIHDHDTDY